MTCHELDERLDDWLDGALAPAAAAEIEAHLASCASCRESAKKLRQLLAHARALPGSLTPPRDLWPGIEARLAHGGWKRVFAWQSPMLLAAAATVAVAVLAALVVQRTPGSVERAAIPAPSRSQLALVSREDAVADPALAKAERDYEAAANALLDALQKRRRTVPPETLARVQQNLELIDRALGEVRQALARDPQNPELNRMLVATHRKKVDVLQRVVRLSTTL